MRITIEINEDGDKYRTKASVESVGVTFAELAYLFKQCALGVGFHHDTINDFFEE